MTFGERITYGRKQKKMRRDLGKAVGTSGDIVGKYERDEVKPTVDVVKRLAEVLDTTVGFLKVESTDMNVLKGPGMLKRLNEIVNLPEKNKEGILYALDGLLRDAKTRLTYP